MIARNKISAATLTFVGSSMSMALAGPLQDETGSGKPKMATSEMELVICQLLDEIETRFRRLDLHFRGPAFEWVKCKYCPINKYFRFGGRHIGFSTSGLVGQYLN